MVVFARARYSFGLPGLNVIETFSSASSSQVPEFRDSALVVTRGPRGDDS